MISVNQSTLRDSLKVGMKEAKKTNSPHLVTYAEPVHFINPLTFFENGRSNFLGERFFWSNPKELTLVGVGVAVTFKGQGEGRAQAIKTQALSLLNRTVGYTGEKALGPVMLGGFSFDSNDQLSTYWKEFSGSNFFIPKFLLTKKDHQMFLSSNFLVKPDEDESAVLNSYEKMRQQLLLTPKKDEEKVAPSITTIQDIQVDQWLKSVQLATEKIADGELKKVVLSRDVLVSAEKDFQIKSILSRLSEDQTNSYIFAFERKNTCFLGATPERLIERNGEYLFTGALAGTIGRGETEEEDQQLGSKLIRSVKNREEHQYVVQMIEQAMDEFTEELHIPSQPELLKVKDVQHLYTPIKGKVKNGSTLLDIIERLHPTPALGGQPREQAMRLIRELETYNRGWYASPIGWMDQTGQGEFAVGIRSGLINKNQAHLFAGCGVVEASDPMEELEETHLKLRPMLAALEGGGRHDR